MGDDIYVSFQYDLFCLRVFFLHIIWTVSLLHNAVLLKNEVEAQKKK